MIHQLASCEAKICEFVLKMPIVKMFLTETIVSG